MKKLNPLFVDSTKFTGDDVLTTIEFVGADIPPGASLFAKIKEPDGEEKVLILERSDQSGKIWRTRAHLPHQQEVTYSFFMTQNYEVAWTTPERSEIVSYLIQETWP